MTSSQTIILISGANTGVGYECAPNLVQTSPSYHVIVGSRSSAKGASAVSALRALSGFKGAVSTVQVDVTDEASVVAAVRRVETAHRRIDVLVNNAGIISRQPTARDSLRETLETNVIGAVRLSFSRRF